MTNNTTLFRIVNSDLFATGEIKSTQKISITKNSFPSLQLSTECAPQCTLIRPSSEPHGPSRQEAIAEKPAKRSI
jgi:hypothetical protein